MSDAWLDADRRALIDLRRIFAEEVQDPTPLARHLVDYLLQDGARPTFVAFAQRIGVPNSTVNSDLSRAGLRRPKRLFNAVLFARLAAMKHAPPDAAGRHLGFSSASGPARLVRASRGVAISMFRKYVSTDDMLDEWRDLICQHRGALSTHSLTGP